MKNERIGYREAHMGLQYEGGLSEEGINVVV